VLQTGIKGDERRTMLFDTGPEGEAWARNAKRLRLDLAPVERIQLSHWHRDHSGAFDISEAFNVRKFGLNENIGGMVTAIEMINAAKRESCTSPQRDLVVDLHPGRPDYRGMKVKGTMISLEADPTFQEIEAAGGRVQKSKDPHTVLDGMFLVSGKIPRQTDYELGLKHGMRFDSSSGTWSEDELIMDERLLACKLKGRTLTVFLKLRRRH
jgi:7,8-dihydropterin-6-yl-methyl-4-(beta-D-ribofuranosyl)aminobenzene 5'-phosphate synthase